MTAAVVKLIGLEIKVTAQTTEVHAEGPRAARVVQKCMYLLPKRRLRVLKRTTTERAGMTEAMTAVVEWVGVVLETRVQ